MSNSTDTKNIINTETNVSKETNSTENFTKKTIENLGNKVRLSDRDEENNLDLYCYVKCDNDSSENLKMCRGVVLEDEKIVMKAFPYTEEFVLNDKENVERIFKEGIKVYDAYEGALIRMFYNKTKWYITTHRKLNAFESKWASKQSFGTCFKQALYEEIKNNNKLSTKLKGEQTFLEKFQNILDKKNQYMFIVRNTQYNRIVCIPPELPSLFHVGTFVNDKLNLEDDICVTKPQSLEFKNVEELQKYVKNIDYMKTQGLIVFTENNKQYKILNDNYDELFKARGNQPSINFRYLQVRMDKDMVDKLYYLYPEMVKNFEDYEDILYDVGKIIYESYVNRYIKKQYVSLPKEEFLVMKSCHSWHLENRRTNRMSIDIVMNVINEQYPTNLNRMIKRFTNNIRMKNKSEQQFTQKQHHMLRNRNNKIAIENPSVLEDNKEDN